MGEHSRPGRRERHALEADRQPAEMPPADSGQPIPGAIDEGWTDHFRRTGGFSDGLDGDSPGPDGTAREIMPAGAAGDVLEGQAFNPPRICGYCQQLLDDGESHLHAGQPNQAGDQRVYRETFGDAVNTYNRTVTDAFASYRTSSEAAWRAYQAAMTRASEAYDWAISAAGNQFDAAARGAGPVTVTDQPAGPYYACCPHCEHGPGQQPDMHEIPCTEGCTPEPIGDIPPEQTPAYSA